MHYGSYWYLFPEKFLRMMRGEAEEGLAKLGDPKETC